MAKKNNSDSTERYEFEKSETLRQLLRVAPSLRQGYMTGPPLEQPPELPPLFELGRIRRPFIQMIRLYLETIFEQGMTYDGFHLFERGLAFNFAFLLRFLAGLNREEERLQLLHAFLKNLDLPNKRGRPGKSQKELKTYVHGFKMIAIWTEEMKVAWNVKTLSESQEKDAEVRLREIGTQHDIIKAIMRSKATHKSSLARVYSGRVNVSYGAARNALRRYLELTRPELGAQI